MSRDFRHSHWATAEKVDRTARPKNLRPKHFKTADYALIKHFFRWVGLEGLEGAMLES